jgi:hypothetical protein
LSNAYVYVSACMQACMCTTYMHICTWYSSNEPGYMQIQSNTYRCRYVHIQCTMCISDMHWAVSCAYECAYVCCMWFTYMHIYQSICVLYVLHIHAHMHWQDHWCRHIGDMGICLRYTMHMNGIYYAYAERLRYTTYIPWLFMIIYGKYFVVYIMYIQQLYNVYA